MAALQPVLTTSLEIVLTDGKVKFFPVLATSELRRPFHHSPTDQRNQGAVFRLCKTYLFPTRWQSNQDLRCACHGLAGHWFVFCEASSGDITEIQLEHAGIGERNHGHLPDSVGDFRALHALELRGNAIAYLSHSIHRLSALEFLDLSDNVLAESVCVA